MGVCKPSIHTVTAIKEKTQTCFKHSCKLSLIHICFLSVSHNRVLYIDTTDICQYMIKIIVPLVDNRIV